MNLTFSAMQFALECHKAQLRKYTGEPYWVHLAEVAGVVSTVRSSPSVIATAWLHDSVEDCNASLSAIHRLFGSEVLDGVLWLSDLEQGNRAQRKAASRARLANAPGWVQDIKAADLISNTASIVKHDPAFAVTYLEEKRLLLKVLRSADERLLAIAHSQIDG